MVLSWFVDQCVGFWIGVRVSGSVCGFVGRYMDMWIAVWVGVGFLIGVWFC